MRSSRRRLQKTTTTSLQSVSDLGDIIEIDGELYVYGGGNELISIEHYERGNNS